MSDLRDRSCVPCQGGVPAIDAETRETLLALLGSDWTIVNEHHLTRTFRFDDFASALAYVNRVAEVSEQQGHHPDVHLAWGRVRLEIWTHKIDGLTESDFILAAKAQALYEESSAPVS